MSSQKLTEYLDEQIPQAYADYRANRYTHAPESHQYLGYAEALEAIKDGLKKGTLTME